MEKQLPFNHEAEAGVLAGILLEPDTLLSVMDIVTPADFYRDANRIIYSALLSMQRDHLPIDYLTVSDELERMGKLEEVGGVPYLMKLYDAELGGYHCERYAEIIVRTATCRRLIQVAGQIALLGYNQSEHAAEKAEALLYQASRRASRSQFTSMSDLMTSYLKELEMLHTHRGTIVGVPTGYTDMDTILGGMQNTDLLVLAGRPGSGKTALAMNIAYNAAQRAQKGVAVFSLEMGDRQLARRLVSMESGVDLQSLRSGWFDDEQWEPITEAIGKLAQMNIWVNDAAGNPITAMRAQMRRLRQHTKIDLIIVDYLQLIEPDETATKRENRVAELSVISRGLKGLAKEFDVPVLALAQLSRKVEERQSKRPMLSDIRESGSIENDADVVAFVYREEYYAKMEGRKPERPNIADIIIAKHRNGEIGDISLYFQAEQTKFSNLEENR